MTIFFRVDSSIQIGTGHVMRCLTLADELKLKSANVSFICSEGPGNLINHIGQNGYKAYCLPSGITREDDRKLSEDILANHAVKPDWLIIDHYNIDTAYESPLRKFAKGIMVIDDLANRRHSCDLLLDQNYNKNGSRYNGLVPENCIQLLGPEYALLRLQFREARENLKRENNEVKKILVFMGGADPTNATGKVLKAIKMLNRPDITTYVVIGIANPHREGIRQLASQMPNTVCYINVDNMAELTVSADLYIGAGGITTWERCCLGVPSIVIVIAENQRSATESLAEDGVVMNLGWDKGVREGAITDAIRQLIGNSQQRKTMSKRSLEIVDGDGVGRVVGTMAKSSY